MFLFAAIPGKDFNFSVGTKLHFTDVNTIRSPSDQIVIPILNDNIAEPRESFVCILNRGIANKVQTIDPTEVIIKINDDDGEYS